MKNLRLWTLLLALVSFGSGLAAGLLVSGRLRPAPPGGAPFEDYHRRFVTSFELSPERSRLLAELLRNYDRELEEVRQRAVASSLSDMEPDLRRLGLRYRGLIRDHVLPAGRREEFDQLARLDPLPPR